MGRGERSGGSSMSRGLAYGLLSARRRLPEMILPVITTATGAFLVVIVFGMSSGIRAQSASLGHADEISRAVVLIAVTVLLVGVVEVAVATTRTVAHRTRELGVLGASGIPRRPVVVALLVEPVIAAVLGSVVGAALAAITGIVLGAAGFAPTGVSVGGLAFGAAIAVAVSIVAAVATSIVPTYNAASRPPIHSLTAGG
jgi:ABC-type antimicrobial peptide transport system permease subunit